MSYTLLLLVHNLIGKCDVNGTGGTKCSECTLLLRFVLDGEIIRVKAQKDTGSINSRISAVASEEVRVKDLFEKCFNLSTMFHTVTHIW
jgi:hypothetical protein